MSISLKTDHTAEAIARLLQQFQGKPYIEGLITSLTDRVQELENVMFEIVDGFLLDTAVGEQLDVLGRIVNQPRAGRDDTTYRLWLKARILVNRGSGLPEEFIALGQLVLPDGTNFSVYEETHATVIISLNDEETDEDLIENLLQIARELKAGGVRLLLFWHTSDDEGFTFAVGDSVVSDTDNGFGDTVENVGGYLASVWE
jgi:hypothetical protein